MHSSGRRPWPSMRLQTSADVTLVIMAALSCRLCVMKLVCCYVCFVTEDSSDNKNGGLWYSTAAFHSNDSSCNGWVSVQTRGLLHSTAVSACSQTVQSYSAVLLCR